MVLSKLTSSKQITFPKVFWEYIFLASFLLFSLLVLPGHGGWRHGKIATIILVGVLGLAQSSKLKDYKNLFSFLLFGHLFLVGISLLNTRDNWVYGLLGEGRSDGLFYHIGLVLYALLIYRLAKENNNFILKVRQVIVISAVLQSIIVILQKVGLDFMGYLTQGQPYSEIYGTFGRSGFVAGFLAVALIFAFMYRPKHISNPFTLLLSNASLIIISLGLGIANNRSSFIAAAFVLSLILLLNFRKGTFFRLLIVIFFVYAGQIIVPNRGEIGEFNRPITSNTTVFTRFKIWDLALQSLGYIPGAPFIGGGPDAFQLALLRHMSFEELFAFYSLEYGWSENMEIIEMMMPYKETDPIRSKTWFIVAETPETGERQTLYFSGDLDKAHNFLLDRLLSFGVFDSLVWLVIYSLPIILLFKRKADYLVFAFALLVIGIYYLAWFPSVALKPLHLSIAALAWGICQTPQKKSANKLLEL